MGDIKVKFIKIGHIIPAKVLRVNSDKIIRDILNLLPRDFFGGTAQSVFEICINGKNVDLDATIGSFCGAGEKEIYIMILYICLGERIGPHKIPSETELKSWFIPSKKIRRRRM